MKPLIVYVCLLFTCTISGQTNDSLLFHLLQITNDTERVNQIYKAGFEIRNTNPELAYQYALTCGQQAERCKSPRHLAKSYNLKGILHYKKGDYSEALQLQKTSLKLNESVQYDYGIAINQTNLGNIYSETGYHALAETSYLKALGAYNRSGNTRQIIKCLINLGVLKSRLKHYEPAIKQFKEALNLSTQLDDKDLMATCNNNIGAVFITQNKPDSAVTYLEEALKLLDLQENEREMADVFINMANINIKQGNFRTARAYLSRADTICDKYDYTEAKIELYQVYALFFEAQEDYKNANNWLKKHYQFKDSVLQISKDASLLLQDNEALSVEQKTEQPAFKNGWILVILCALTVVILLFLMKHRR